jgi:hypothetical protein
LGLAAAGCSTPATEPVEFPRLVTQPYFEPILIRWALDYREDLGRPLPFDLHTETRAEGQRLLEAGEAQLMVTGGDLPAEWFVTPLGPQGLGVIVNAANPVRQLSLAELRDLLSGRVASWEAVGGRDVPVQPVVPLPGEPFTELLEGRLLDTLRPWPGSLLGPTPEAAVSLVAESAGAFGFVPLAAVTDDVRLVRIDGVLPGEATIASGTYPLSLELLAASLEEPTPPLRDFLVWIQARLP